MSKSGTPTMGGIAFVSAILLTLLCSAFALIYSKLTAEGISLLIALTFAFGNALIGLFDDLMKLYRKKNGGLTPLQKILLQSLMAILFLMARYYFLKDSTVINVPFFSIDLGPIYYPMAMIVLLGIVNCANLTDGIDGLATSVAITIGGIFLFLSESLSSEVSIISSAIIGGGIGFLLFNAHPAKIFMGDTGSLFLGALTVSLAFSAKNPLLIIPIGAVYVVEGTSVILQVTIYKLTKKRLFKMAPIHHHFEKSGLDENRICVLAVIATLLASSFVQLFLGA